RPAHCLAHSLALVVWTLSAAPVDADDVWGRRLPWREAGLTEHQAAAHLLDRLTYGPRPGEVEEVAAMGLGVWLEGQLAGHLPGALLNTKLARLSALELDHRQMIEQYSYSKNYLAQQAIAARVIDPVDYDGENGESRRRDAEAALMQFAMRRGQAPETKLLNQLKSQKVLRAAFSESQLVEVLTDFWFNHFNVSATHDTARVHLLAYERDAIRPHVLGSFRQLLGATAKHPAMLKYLGNYHSVANAHVMTLFDLEVSELGRLSPLDNPTLRQQLAKTVRWTSPEARRRQPDLPRGLNENYARELLELHTLGVGGGYSQRDVIEVARALTGWTTFPPGRLRDRLETALVSPTAINMGFVVDDEFVFRSDQHDSEAKSVLGLHLEAGRGIDDGEEVLDLVARHPATARHLMTKLATRLISEPPPLALVDHLAEIWEVTDGDLAEAVLALVESPEFWSPEARRSKIKTPFELAISSLRALDVEISDPDYVIRWIRRMGQNLYSYAAPTGFPDEGDRWTPAGPLLARINFAQVLAAGKVRGVEVDLEQFLGQRQLQSVEEAVVTYFPILMPQRDPQLTLELIGALPDEASIESAQAETSADVRPPSLAVIRATRQHAARAVGLLLASPEFQVH
ncbi:MAG: DUF1800 domain-containing protein, partial [Acidobacteriota bacterium]